MDRTWGRWIGLALLVGCDGGAGRDAGSLLFDAGPREDAGMDDAAIDDGGGPDVDAAGDAGRPDPYDGVWAGTTSQGQCVSFEVREGVVTRFVATLELGPCTSTYGSDVGVALEAGGATFTHAASDGATFDTTIDLTLGPDGAEGTWTEIAYEATCGAAPSVGTEAAGSFSAVRLEDPADLVLAAISTTAVSVARGGTISVASTIGNGGGAACAFEVEYALSADASWDEDDVVLAGRRMVASIGADATMPATTVLTIPADAPLRDYFLCANVDPRQVVLESEEANNTGCTAVGIDVVAPPDLVMDQIDYEAGAISAGPVAVRHVARNAGELDASAVRVGFVLSADEVLGNADDRASSTIADVGPLAAGASRTLDTDVALPTALAPGAYRICAIADPNETVSEGDEANNARCGASLLTITGADVAITALSTSATRVTGGASFPIVSTVVNRGFVSTPSFTIALHLSADAVYGGADDIPFTATRSVSPLAGGAMSNATTNVVLPANVPGGTYYVCARADAGDAITEADEDDNEACSSGTIEVELANLRVANVATAVTAALPGATISVTNAVTNDGLNGAAASALELRLSTDDVFGGADDHPFANGRSVPAIAAGGTSNATTSVALPAAPLGVYHLCARADAADSVVESDEADNTSCSAATIVIGRPDLRISEVSTTTMNVAPGGGLALVNAVTNDGAIAAGSFSISFRLSLDAVYDEADLALTATRNVSGIVAGATSMATTSLSVPAGTAPGAYYVCASADTADTITEPDETNNTRCTISPVQVLGADLVISAISTTTVALAPEAGLPLANTVHNAGAAPAGSSQVHFHLSADAVYGGADDIAFTTTRSVGSVAVMASLAATTTLTIPRDTPTGDYYVCAMADGALAVGELDEANNSACTATVVRVHRADLTVGSASAPASAVVPGDLLMISSSTANLGPAGAASFQIGFHLSGDATFGGADDVNLGTVTASSLSAGTGRNTTDVVTVPDATPDGDYFVCVFADVLDAEPESDESNNTRCTAATIRVERPDIVLVSVETAATSVAVGANLPVSRTLTNAGPITAPSFAIEFQLSSDAVYGGVDTVALTSASWAISDLDPAESDTFTYPLIRVAAGTPPGTYYVCSRADWRDEVPETNETNNTACTATTVMVTP